MHCLHQSTGICDSCNEHMTNMKKPPPKRTWYHMDGSVCPDWDRCDTYEHYCAKDLAQLKAWAGEKRDVSDTVDELIDGRVNVYGDPTVVFIRHAQVWSGILGVEVQPWQVALCMQGYKLVRTAVTPDYSDNSDDIEGYLDIFRTLMPDMVQARNTAEYLAGGGQGARS